MLTEKLPQNSENMPFLLIAVSVTAGSVCLVIVLQAIAFYFVTSKKLKSSKDKRLSLAQIIDCVAFTFYSLVIFIIQIIIPVYFYLS